MVSVQIRCNITKSLRLAQLTCAHVVLMEEHILHECPTRGTEMTDVANTYISSKETIRGHIPTPADHQLLWMYTSQHLRIIKEEES